MADVIKLECSACGNTAELEREIDPSILPEVVRIVSNECPECDAAWGCGSEAHYDAKGDLVFGKVEIPKAVFEG